MSDERLDPTSIAAGSEIAKELLRRERELCEALRPFAELAIELETTPRRTHDQFAVVVVSIEALRRAAALVFGPGGLQ